MIAPGAMKAMHARGGTVFRILEGGRLQVGDPVVVEAAPEAPREDPAG
ncbi:MOSC domain-containing protein YiiM [Phycicoccus sp. 3266]|nr:MOSC domain-containing protein YiiM [Phycicoccus sp. 3266]